MPDRPQVALLKCPDYDRQRVEAAVRDALAHLGGMASYVRPGWRVALKPNIVRASPPERAIVTHPEIVRAVAILVQEAGATPVLIESPGGPPSEAWVRRAFKQSGIAAVAEEIGVEVCLSVAGIQVAHPEGKLLKRLDILESVTQVDAVINLPKLKTHNLTRLTAATKNLFGLVPGLLKMGYHSKLQDAERFSEMLIDILTFIKPVLNITDAIVAMDGNGPSGGDPFSMGLLIASPDPYASDVVAAELVGFEPLSMPPIAAAARRGLTTGHLADVDVLGQTVESARVKGFRPGTATKIDSGIVPRLLRRAVQGPLAARTVDGQECSSAEGYGELNVTGVPTPLARWMNRQLLVNPHANGSCIGCGICAKSCPVNAIEILDHRAHMDTARCIRCYCCHELCPEEAIELRRTFIGRLLTRS